MLSFRGQCLRISRQPLLLNHLHPIPPQSFFLLNQSVRNAANKKTKLKNKAATDKPKPYTPKLRRRTRERLAKAAETPREYRERMKAKAKKESDKRRQVIERKEAAFKGRFRLPYQKKRPDAVPFGTAMQLLRGWSNKGEIFVRSKASRWLGETKVIAKVKVVPNDHNPRGITGRVQFPHPVVAGKAGGSEQRKEKITVIMFEGEDETPAKNVGMEVRGRRFLENVNYLRLNFDGGLMLF